MILRVALPLPLDRLFDYLPNDLANGESQSYSVGARVQVRFGQRQLIGLIAEITAESDYPVAKLKPIEKLLDDQPMVDAELMQLGRWAANYYQYPIGDALLHLVPNLARKEERPEPTPTPLYRLNTHAQLEQISTRAVKQRALFHYMQTQNRALDSSSLREAGFEKRVLDSLITLDLVECFVAEPGEQFSTIEVAQEPLRLNAEQQIAVDRITCDTEYRSILLAGVTGSGKTEVYLQAITPHLLQGKQVLILVPEIGLTPQLVSRFSARFAANLVTLHSGMSDRARFEAWERARSGEARIIIGTRSSIFVPLKNPGLILIDEEHDTSLKQQEGFRYHARDLALVRAQNLNIPVVLGSATPALESLLNTKLGRYELLQLRQRAGAARPPRFELIDNRNQEGEAGITDETLRQMRAHIGAGNQVLVFINRRGFSPSLVCQSCGEAVHCTRCDAHMTLHRRPPRLHCHHCDRQTPIPRQCNQCDHTDLRPNGSGTERIEERLQSLFTQIPVRRVDRDSTHSREAFARLMADVGSGEPQILVGTQMLAKGHHFPDVTLVVILNLDAGLLSADFRAMERTAQLMLQVAGRAGRADKPGTVLIQTQHPQHPVLATLLQDGYLAYAEQELRSRETLGLPPFTYQAIVRSEAQRQGWSEAYLMRLRQLLNDAGAESAGLLLAGPFPANMEKRAGLFRAYLVLTGARRSALQHLLRQARAWIEQDPDAPRVRLSIDVDPIEAQ